MFELEEPERDPVLELLEARSGRRRLGKCEILGKLGQGGMGTVYQARHLMLDLDVAVKVLPPELAARDPSYRERFFREARAAASISHPHLIRVLDVDCQYDLCFLVMELVEGKTTQEILEERGKLPEAHAVTIIAQAASALGEGD